MSEVLFFYQVGDLNIPYFIIRYLAEFFKIEYNEEYIILDKYYIKIINKLNEVIKLNNIDFKETKTKLRFISPFSNEEWELENIIKAFDHLFNYNYHNLSNLIFGDKSNKYPYNINNLMLYRICKLLNYKMKRNTKPEHLILYLSNLSNSNLKVNLINNIIDMNISDLISNFYEHLSPKEEIKQKVVKDNLIPLDITYSYLINIKTAIKKAIPANNNEAIILAAYNLNLNLVESSTPYEDYYYFNKFKSFISHCTKFNVLYNYNKNWYNTLNVWCDKLSPFLYSIDQLYDFCLKEGFNVKKNINELHSTLVYNRTINNFYFERVPNAYNVKKTIIDLNVSEITNNNIVCFGNFNENNWIYLSVDELYDFFEINKVYIDPINSQPLFQHTINKLRNHFQNSEHKIKNLIKYMDDTKDILDNEFIKLKNQINSCNEIDKTNIKLFFDKGIELGFYMRGWKLNDFKYPLKSHECCYELDNEGVVIQKLFFNILNCRNELLNIYNSLPLNIKSQLSKLHVLKFSGTNNKINFFDLYINGVTLYMEHNLISCIDVILGDENRESSCIRTNSNWVLFSYSWYSFLLGYELDFKLENIDYIN